MYHHNITLESMRRFAIILFLIFTALTAFPTGQATECINENGVDKQLCSLLLELDTITFSRLKIRIPERLRSTALWRNYIGHWKIKNDSLFLDSIIVPDQNSKVDKYILAKINDIYATKRTDSGYFADWVNDTLRIVSGNQINYVHSGWMSTWEHEELVAVEKGIVKGRVAIENRTVNSGVNDLEIRHMCKNLDLGEIPGRIIVSLGYASFEANGNPAGCNVKVMKSCGDKTVDDRVVKVIEDWLLTSHPLPIYYINGRYESGKSLILRLPV